MRKFLTLAFIAFSTLATAQQHPEFNQALADSLGADDYGMKPYVLVLLKTGSNTDADADARNQAFRSHFENIQQLSEKGLLVVAGPMLKNTNGYRGIFILNTPDVARAAEMLRTDGAVAKKYLDAEYYPWYGSAALGTYVETHKRIERKKP